MPSFVVKDSKVPTFFSWFFTIAAITLGPFIFIRKGYYSAKLLNHERIHVAQQYEMLFVGNWLLYGLFWLIGYIKTRDTHLAYINNPFEKEAYGNASNDKYLKKRRFWSWTRYV